MSIIEKSLPEGGREIGEADRSPKLRHKKPKYLVTVEMHSGEPGPAEPVGQ